MRNHLALAAPAFGKTARELYSILNSARLSSGHPGDVKLHLTKMAHPEESNLVTNEDVAKLIDKLVKDKTTRVIILNAALCDYTGEINEYVDTLTDEYIAKRKRGEPHQTPSGKYAPRLKTSEGSQNMTLRPAHKIVGRIRKDRKDIFVVGFKTTANATPDEQYLAGLDLLKKNSLNLVLANDTVTRHNMVIAPEETRYFEGDRNQALVGLCRMVLARMENTFTRSTVRDGKLAEWTTDPRIPDNLRQVVNHLVERGAYKPFNGSTAGHFAVKLHKGKVVLTSRRKTNYTEPGGLDLVQVEYDGDDKVIAYGAKPSVGGQSQRIVFTEHPDLDCIVHFHSPLKADAPIKVPVAPQWQNECGSHQCGANTSRHLKPIVPDGLDSNLVQTPIHAVMLDNHGPNIVFSRATSAEKVIAFIEANFDLEAKTGGLVAA